MVATILETLKNIDVFSGLDCASLNVISEFSRKYHFPDGMDVFDSKEDNQPDLFFLLEGQLDVYSPYTGIGSERATQFGTIDRGVFGEIGWALKSRRTARVRCRGDAKILRVDGGRLHQFLDANPVLGFTILKRLYMTTARSFVSSNNVLAMLLRHGT